MKQDFTHVVNELQFIDDTIVTICNGMQPTEEMQQVVTMLEERRVQLQNLLWVASYN